MKLVFDLESNNKDPLKVTKVHCIETFNLETNESKGFNPKEINQGVVFLSDADLLVGHNIVGYDLFTLHECHKSSKLDTVPVFDTLIASRLMFPDLREIDKKEMRDFCPKYTLPDNLIGKHSLEAWGYRLGILKGDYAKSSEDCWDEWSEEMQEYCKQDVLVTKALYEYIQSKIYLLPEMAFDIEQQFQHCINFQRKRGILVDVKKAQEIVDFLEPKRDELLNQLQEVFPPKIVETVFIPKKNNKVLGYVKDEPFIKKEEVPFNPKAPKQVIDRLKELGWVPVEFTKDSRQKYPRNPDKWTPSTKEEHIKDFNHPSVKVLLEFKQVCNVITKISGGEKGKQSWLENIDEDGKLRHNIFPFGTQTGRCSHSPNVTQLQKNDYLPYVTPREFVLSAPIDGKETVLLGCDACSLEARCLANATYKYDNGELANELINGDIHTKNQKLIQTVVPLADGKEGREKAKTALYATIYGGSAGKVAISIGFDRSKGDAIREALFKSVPALGSLKHELESFAKNNGFIIAIDGRKIPIEKGGDYLAVNYYLQNMGAIVMKVAYIKLFKKLKKENLLFNSVYIIMYNHDEFEEEVLPEYAEKVGELSREAIKEAGEYLEFNCELDGEYHIGNNWAEVH